MFNYVSSKPRVCKFTGIFYLDKPWVVIHAIGTASFDTWREAMDYALGLLVQLNGYRTTGLYA